MKPNSPLISLSALLILSASAFPLAAGEIALIKGKTVNVRGQPSLQSEVVLQLHQGDPVVVLEEIPVASPKTGEPASWTRIRMPENTPVWVFAPYIDPAAGTVTATRLNLRAGPGERFSIVGRLAQGDKVNEVRVVEHWMEIETPEAAYAFVASDLLEPQASAEPIATQLPQTEPPPPPPPAVAGPLVASPPPPVEQPEPEVITPSPPSASSEKLLAERPVVVPSLPPPEAPARAELLPPVPGQIEPRPQLISPPPAFPEHPPKRIVRREGVVRGAVSIKAPTHFELTHPDTRRSINYLNIEYLEDIDLREWRGRRVVVTGEEAIDPRWPRIPVIDVETIHLVF